MGRFVRSFPVVGGHVTGAGVSDEVGSADMDPTGVTAGSYTSADITVDAAGRITAAASGAGGGGLTDGDKGDITVSGSGATWAIDAGAVTPAKMSDGTALSVLGRAANSAGVRADIAAPTGGRFKHLMYDPATDALVWALPASAEGYLRYGDAGDATTGELVLTIPLGDGGTGSALSDPGADRLMFWDHSAGAVTWLTAGSGLSISGTTISATGSGGTVTSVGGASSASGFALSGGPITGAGTLTFEVTDAATARATLGAAKSGAVGSSGLTTSGGYMVLGRSSFGGGVIQEIPLALEFDGTFGGGALALKTPLSVLAGLTIGADKLAYYDGLSSAALTTLTAAGRALIDDADAAAQRTTLGAAASGGVGSSGLTMATARLLGRTTASTGAVEEITVGSGLSLSGGTLTATGGSGTVTSVAVSGGTTGLTTSGGPVTTSGTITLAGTLAVANGGTGATTASAARTALGLAIGTDVQAQDAELAAIAGLTSAADRLPYFTGSGTAALATFSSAGRALVDDADAAAQRTTLGLVIGTNVQAFDATLAALAGLTIAANSLTIGTGADAFSQTTFAANTFPARASTGSLVAKTITDFGLSLVDDSNAAAGRTTLGLGTSATVNTGTSGATIPLLNAANTWSAQQNVYADFLVAGSGGSPSVASFTTSQIILYVDVTTGGSAVFSGNGSGLSALSASNVTAGTLPKAQAPAAVNCSVYHSTTQSISDSTWTSLSFDSENDDTDALHSTSSNTSRVTVPSGLGGVYLLTAVWRYALNAAGVRFARFRINGSTVPAPLAYVAAVVNDATTVSITYSARLAAGDYVECQAWQNSGGALNVTAGSSENCFTATRVGP